MIIKTRESLIEELTETVRKNHPYDCPEVVAVPIIGNKIFRNNSSDKLYLIFFTFGDSITILRGQ